MQLVGGFVQDAVSSDSAAVVQSMCNAVLDIVLLFTAPSPKARHQLEQVMLGSHTSLCSAHRLPYMAMATKVSLSHELFLECGLLLSLLL